MINSVRTLTVVLVSLLFSGRIQSHASFAYPAKLSPEAASKLTIDPKRCYQINNTTNGLDALFDGITDVTVNTGWGKMLANFDAYYPLLDGEQMRIESIRFYDGAGTNTDAPMTLSIITDNWERIPIARFIGHRYQTWVGPDPDKPTDFGLKSPVTNARYLVLNTSGAYPTEMELYGSQIVGKEPNLLPRQFYPFRHTLGINGFEWDVQEAVANAAVPVVNDTRITALKSFSSMRHYLYWGKLENQPGVYTYNPTSSGNWTFDDLYGRLQAEGIEVLACLQTLPGWLYYTYPTDGRDYGNAPTRFGSDRSDPKSYIEHARMAFQYAARYGFNTHVDPTLLSVSPVGAQAGVNSLKIGLGLVRYIECNNEPDKTWKGRNGYQSAREYAANLSAFYDGHKHTLGPGVGVKNADSSMTVVLGGLSATTTDYMRAMIDWCREFRGYRADGSVNLCWDVMNQHVYATNTQSLPNGGAARGAAPERAGVGEQAAKFVKLARQYASGMPVWITEAGYDVNPKSPMRAIAIGKKSVLETQADWILRTSLLYSRVGIDRVFYFQAYDFDLQDSTRFASMGLLNGADKTRKPAADFLYQAKNLLGDYYYKETLSNDPLVDRYELNGRSAYVLLIPDEKGRTGTYALPIPKGNTVRLCTPAVGRDEMSSTLAVSQTGTIMVNVSETPVFIMPESDPKNDLSSLQIYPNPTTDVVTFHLENDGTKPIVVTIYDHTGRRCGQSFFLKSGDLFNQQVDLSSLPAGSYLLDIRQGDASVVKKISKTP